MKLFAFESTSHWREAFSRLTGVDLYMLAYMRDCTRLANIDYGGFLQYMDRAEKENCTLKRCKSIWHLGSCNLSSRYTAACKDELKHRCRSGPGRIMFRQLVLWMQDLSRLWQRWISTGTSLPIVVTGKERTGLGYKPLTSHRVGVSAIESRMSNREHQEDQENRSS
ncbi:hypothetical protein K457DRAFT_1880043 [Linnemannia elongata AG-77]|uniref:Uncharacterized protein n=1 Tax=Linnemannia elongata AG-77 TaxID=1314771 RepID=A0A197JKJ7_9FUNG|nr:hypothetical protein K457DRAFT_1880043 [Linnemannia elongata AG-77]